MHTVEQAKSLWCPLVRHGSTHCIGDHCAMWRWGEFTTVSRDEVVADPSLGPGGKRVIQVAASAPVAGYCGLAGKPEVAP